MAQASIQSHLRSINKAARQTLGSDQAFLELHIPITAVTELERAGPASPAHAHQLTLLDTPGAPLSDSIPVTAFLPPMLAMLSHDCL